MAKKHAPAVIAFPEFVSFKSVCASLGFSARKLEGMIATEQGFPKPFKMGAERFFRPADIAAWINAKADEANAPRDAAA